MREIEGFFLERIVTFSANKMLLLAVEIVENSIEFHLFSVLITKRRFSSILTERFRNIFNYFPVINAMLLIKQDK